MLHLLTNGHKYVSIRVANANYEGKGGRMSNPLTVITSKIDLGTIFESMSGLHDMLHSAHLANSSVAQAIVPSTNSPAAVNSVSNVSSQLNDFSSKFSQGLNEISSYVQALQSTMQALGTKDDEMGDSIDSALQA